MYHSFFSAAEKSSF